MRTTAAAIVMVAWAAVAQAQPFPGAVLVGGGWVPCSHQIAIDAGLGCGSVRVGVPVAAAFEVGRYYRNPSDTCTFKMLALASTYQHRRVVLVGETTDGRYAGCPEAAYFFDPSRAPEPGWRDVTETIPAEARE